MVRGCSPLTKQNPWPSPWLKAFSIAKCYLHAMHPGTDSTALLHNFNLQFILCSSNYNVHICCVVLHNSYRSDNQYHQVFLLLMIYEICHDMRWHPIFYLTSHFFITIAFFLIVCFSLNDHLCHCVL